MLILLKICGEHDEFFHIQKVYNYVEYVERNRKEYNRKENIISKILLTINRIFYINSSKKYNKSLNFIIIYT